MPENAVFSMPKQSVTWTAGTCLPPANRLLFQGPCCSLVLAGIRRLVEQIKTIDKRRFAPLSTSGERCIQHAEAICHLDRWYFLAPTPINLPGTLQPLPKPCNPFPHPTTLPQTIHPLPTSYKPSPHPATHLPATLP